MRRRTLHRSHTDSGVGSGASRYLGMSESDILRSYPSLRSEDLVNAWVYFRTHRDEIEQHIRENEQA